MSKRNILLSIIAVVAALLLGSTNAFSATIFSAGSGNWSSASTWTGGVVPTSTDDISVGNHTITIDQDVTINSIAFTGTGVIQPATTGTFTITVTGNVNLTNAGDIRYSNGAGRLNIVFAGTSAQTVTLVENADGTQGLNVYNITFANGTNVDIQGNFEWRLYGNMTLEGNATVTVGAYHTAKVLRILGTSNTVTIPTTASLTLSNLTIDATATNVTWAGSATISGTITVAAGGKFNATSGTITLTNGTGGAAPIIVNSTLTTAAGAEFLSFYNVILNNNTSGQNYTPATSFQVKGNFSKSGASNFAPTNGFVVFKNNATPNNAKTISFTGGTNNFFNLLIDDGSYVKLMSNVAIANNGSFEVVGSGSFTSDAITTPTLSFAGAGTITTSTLSTCEFWHLSLPNATSVVTTTSNFTIKGNLTIGNATASFTASAPSTITFAGTTTIGITGTTTFNNIVVKNGASASTTGNYTVTGDITVENGASLTMSGTSIVTLGGGTTKNIVNNGTLRFYDLTIADVANNVVQTESDFIIDNILTVGGNTNGGSFMASGNSTVIFSPSSASIVPIAVGTQGSLTFQNLKFIDQGLTTDVSDANFTIKGDLINDVNITFDGTGGIITFQGTTQQKIMGNGTTTQLNRIVVNNPIGLKLMKNVELVGGTATVTFTLGNIDLNGYTMTLSDAAPVISGETSTKRFINTASSPGIVATNTISLINANNSGIGTSSMSGPSNVTVQRILAARKIGDYNSVKRYYSVNGDASITAVNLAYFDDELNGNTATKLWAYATSSATTTTIGTALTEWQQQTSTAGTNVVQIPSTSIPSGTTHYIGLRNREVKLEGWPTTGVHNDLALETMPLVAGSATTYDATATDDIILARFAITPYFTQTGALTQIKATLSQSVSGILSNIYLLEATNLTLPIIQTIATGTISGTTVTFTISGTPQNITALTTRYFYIAGTVTNSVNTSTPNITITVAPSDITIANCDITGSAQSSPAISFTGQNVSLNVNNTPLSKPVMKGSTSQVIFGFTLVPPTGSPNITINSVKIKANLSDGATSSHFTNFEIYRDDNKDGVVNGSEPKVNNATIVNINSSGYVIFNGWNGLNNQFSTGTQYIVRCDVSSSATVGGKIQLVIESAADIALASPAMIASGGPYDGGTFTVSDNNITPTRLVVTNFGLATIPSGDDPEKKDREVISGSGINIVIQSQDNNGNPGNVTSATGVNITVTSGTATVANGTGTIANGTNTLTISGLQLTNALGYGPITITVTPTSGMTSLTPATYTNILIYAIQPSSTAFTSSTYNAVAATPTTATVTVNTGSGQQYLVVAREGNWPAIPQDGVVYDQVPGNNFSATSGSGNYFTGTGSVVVIKSTGTGSAQTFTVSGLTAGKTYYFAIYEFNGGSTPTSKPNYVHIYEENTNKVKVDMPSAAPTVAASGVTFGQVTTSSIKVEWTNGDGAKRIVIARAGGAPTGTPVDGTTYTANSAYGDPTTALGDGFVVYNGTANTFTMTNLLPGTTYHFAVYEYNGSGVYTNYIATAATGNRATLAAEPTIQAHSIDIQPVSNTSLKVTWVNGNGAGRVLLGKVDAPISNADFPLDQGNTLTANAAFGSGTASGDAYVLATTSPVTVTGLEFGKTYYFRVFEYNGTAGAYTSSTVNYLTAAASNNPNYGVSDADEPANNNMLTAKYYGTANGTLVDGIISNPNDVDWYSVEPNVENGYKNLRIKLLNQPMNYTIELYDKNGRRLRSSKFSGTQDEVIVINNLPIGVYYIKVYSENGDYSITPYKVTAMESELEYKSETP